MRHNCRYFGHRLVDLKCHCNDTRLQTGGYKTHLFKCHVICHKCRKLWRNSCAQKSILREKTQSFLKSEAKNFDCQNE